MRINSHNSQNVSYWLIILNRDRPNEINEFVKKIFTSTEDANVILELGQNPISRSHVLQFLQEFDLDHIIEPLKNKKNKKSLSISIYGLYWHYFYTSNLKLANLAREKLSAITSVSDFSTVHSLGVSAAKISNDNSMKLQDWHADFNLGGNRLVICGNILSIRNSW